MNNSDWLGLRAKTSPKKIALLEGDRSWTYRTLNNLVADIAGRLAVAGVKAEQHVAVLMPNRVEYVGLIHALARLGAVLVPLNVRLTVPELRWQIEQASCSFIICDHHTEPQAASLATNGLEIVSIDRSQSPEVKELHSFAADDAIDWQRGPLDLNALQGIIFTSGTTGKAKGAMLSFGNHFWSATASAFRLGTDPRDRWLVCMPLYHVGGIAIIFRCCLYGTTVVLQTGFDPALVSQALDSQEITLISLVPTMLHRLLKSHKQSLAGSMLRCILLGGAATPPTVLAECQPLNLPVATTYGLTESASQVVTESLSEERRKSGSVGKPLMFSTVRIVGDEGQELPPGEIGEIVVQGPTIMQGYYNDPTATQKALRNGQLYTGDMGYLDEEGDLWVVQRRADLIISGGENVYPAEVEQTLQAHPAVQDVCVVGIKHDEWGWRVAAAVVINGREGDITEEALISFCRERLAGYKQPRLISFVDALPRTASGKVRRDEVRTLITKEKK